MRLDSDRKFIHNAVNLNRYDPDKIGGIYDFPTIKATQHIPEALIGFNYARTAKDTGAGIHFFLDDYQFQRFWNRPEENLRILHRFDCALSPDFSLFADMPMAMKIWNVYRSRLLGQLMQDDGIIVIPTLTWAEPETFGFCFDSIEPGGVVAVSTVGVMRDKEAQTIWSEGMQEALVRLAPSCVLCYGKHPDFFDFGDTPVRYYSTRDRW